jgi:hypothetical protein
LFHLGFSLCVSSAHVLPYTQVVSPCVNSLYFLYRKQS